MSLAAPSSSTVNGASLRIGIAAARYNQRLVGALLEQVRGHLRAAGVKEKRLVIVRVPGSNELPIAVQLLGRRGKFDALLALGVLIRGDTPHYELIASAVAHGLQRVALEEHIPVINGVIVAENRAQAEARCLGKIARSAEFARAALAMAVLKRRSAK